MLTRHALSVALITALAGISAPHEVAAASVAKAVSSPSLLAAGAQSDHVLLPRGIYGGNEIGLQLVQDYGTLQLWRVDTAHRLELNAIAPQSALVQSRAALFEAGAFDPAQPVAVPSAFGVAKETAPRIHLVQLYGPVTGALMDEIVGSGAKVLAPLSGNSYAVLADEAIAIRIVQAAGHNPLLRAVSPLPAFYKLAGGLAEHASVGLSPGNEIDVTVQIAKHADSAKSKALIESLHQGTERLTWDNRLTLESLRLRIVETDLTTIANLPDVFAIEPFTPRRKYDEVQAQIVAGNFNGTQSGPSGIGYRAWLAGRGFPTTSTSYPIVDVVDDGLGTGVAANAAGDVTFRHLGLAANASRVATIGNCTNDASGDGDGGHGHLNTNIVGGYDERGDTAGIQTPFEDPNGYLRGQGINPYARLAHTKIFTNAGGYNISNCGNTDAGVIKSSQDRGAPITSNSWGAGVAGDYDDSSMAYDIGTRDGDLVEANNQPMIHIFAAGNDGSGASTVGSPGSGKNVITVGASENDRPGPDESGVWTDGCAIGASGANNAMDVISFSSRGPAEGVRTKPEVIAPGTHIQGTASTSPSYNGSGVCDQFRPGAQTVYAASSGTSHSTPAIAGVSSLMYYWLQQAPRSIAAPSAALMKAYMMAHPTYLTGVSANDNLPSNSQGFGMPNLGAAFDASTLQSLVDQTQVFTATGQTFVLTGDVANNTKPVRIALAWSDAPGAVSDTTPQVNNLNLTAVVNGVSYTGNLFTGQFSTAGGGAADSANNYEAIFLPAGTTGAVQITVTAATIAGDGIPNTAPALDQDFALVVSNVSQSPDFDIDATPSTALSCGAGSSPFTVNVGSISGYNANVNLSAPGLPAGLSAGFAPSSGNAAYSSTLTLTRTGGLADGNHVVTVSGNDGVNTRSDTITLQHSGAAPTASTLATPATGAVDVALRPTFSWSAVAGVASYVLEVDDNPAFSSIDYSATVAGTSHQPPSMLAPTTTYHWRVRAVNNCGAGANSAVFSFTTLTAYCSTPNLAIPDNNNPGVTSTITVPSGGNLSDLDVELDVSHSWVGDLRITLRHTSPNTTRVLMDQPNNAGGGCSGDNFSLIGDDEGGAGALQTGCLNTTPAYTAGGRYTTSETLSAFDGQTISTGNWELNISDRANLDTGTLNRWCLVPTIPPPNAVDDNYNATEDTQLNVDVASGVLANDTGGTLTAVIVTPPGNGALVGGLATDGSFSYLPGANFCGNDTFVYQASNGAQTDNATVTIAVACANDAPTAANDAYSTSEDTPLAVTAPGVLANDGDVDTGTTLTAALVANTANGSTTVGSNGAVNYSPNANYCNGGTPTDDFTYRANDGSLNSNVATGAITVTCVNDAPSAVGTIADQSGAEGQTIATLATAGNFNDLDGDTLSYSATGLPGGLSINPSSGAIDGTLTFLSAGVHNVVVTATDPANATATQAFTWTVSNNNRAPSFTSSPVLNVNEDALYTYNVTTSDLDVDDTLSVVGSTVPTWLTFTPGANGTGTLTGTPSNTAVGPHNVTLSVSDGTTTVDQAFTVTVANTNDAPTVVSPISDRSDAENTNINFNVSGSFSDVDAGQTLTFSTASSLPGGVTLTPAGVFSGTIAFTASGVYTVTVTANDGNGGTVSDTFVWTVTDVPQNAAPTFTNEPYAFNILVNAAAATAVGTVSASDANVGDTLTFAITGGNTGNAFAINPATGAITVATSAAVAPSGTVFPLNVSVSDGNGGSDASTVTITVVPPSIFRNGFE